MTPTALTAAAASTLAVGAPRLTGALASGASSDGTWLNNSIIQRRLWPATLETLEMTGVSGALTVVFGLLLGLALISTGRRGQHPNRVVYEILSQIVNMGRSMPFIILMVAIIPLTRLIVGTSLGWQAACVPLTVGAIPFYARLVETAINDVDHGKVEAALMMGASSNQITWGVLVREALPTLVSSATVTIITLLGYSAMAGTVGGGGLGDLAIQYGYNGFAVDIMVIVVVLIVAIVGVIQVCGDMLSRLVDHR
ncbi:methionine ABC transporter permease [Actinomyces israelii]|uniref:methionine ABC transporter permease n=1 Tax=Actinomyces israelii TaxID=1659 RepID=UPI002352F6CD|nr:methionine ABC transporter permease [Actinomyces israelii]